MADVVWLGDIGRHDVATVGGKAANLGELVRAGFAVPPGFVVGTKAYRAFLADNELAAAIDRLAARGPDTAAEIRAVFVAAPIPDPLRLEIAEAYAALGSPAVAVRSSATAEDQADASFAGQQDTYLGVTGVDDLTAAVRDCWASLWTDRAMAYRAQRAQDPAGLSLAVVVQQMVPAEAAGVLFTANPLTGRTEETVISAAPGLGEAVVGGSVDTEETVVDLARRQIVSRRLLGDTPVLADETAYALAELGVRIAAHFGTPQDIEWALADNSLAVLQSRPITALAPTVGPAPADWSVPDPHLFYVRASITEQLPDPLSPLFADLIDGAVTRSLTALMDELVGAGTVRPGDVGLPTVNGYAYYAYRWSGMGRISLRTLKALPVLGGGRRSGRERWRTYARPRYAQAVADWAQRDVLALPAGELLQGVVTLLDAGAEYYTAVQTVIPVAAGSEMVFSRFYRALVRRPGDPPPTTFLLGFDSVPIRSEKSLYDLAGWVCARPVLAGRLTTSSTPQLLADRDDPGPDGWREFWVRLATHLEAYGHLVYNLDVLNAVPADDPGPLLDALRFYLGSGSLDPYERQRQNAAARQRAGDAVTTRLDPVRRRIFRRLLRLAQQSAPVREDALADVGLAWPQLRVLLAEAGRRLVTRGVVDAATDVHWLRWAELVGALSDGDPTPRQQEVEDRRRLWRGRRQVTPPQVLPVRRWVRFIERMLPAASAEQTGDVLSGQPGSAGRVTAVARVVGGPADFGEFRAGEVLVASITTPAWTPLFVRASAVVTDVGGPLSHSSIVAREYGIPAVLGTGVGTRRIRSGQRVTVDGDAGRVTLHPDG